MSEYQEQATTDSTGSGNAAAVYVPQARSTVSVGWDVNGAATISVEVSHDGSTWFDRTHDVVTSQPSGAEEKAETFSTGFQHVRAYANQNLTALAISAKG